jgi:hypothetical protein
MRYSVLTGWTQVVGSGTVLFCRFSEPAMSARSFTERTDEQAESRPPASQNRVRKPDLLCVLKSSSFSTSRLSAERGCRPG